MRLGYGRTLGADLLVLVVGILACGSQTIPLVAVEGTTITLALPASFPTGFGTAWVGLPGTGSNSPIPPDYDSASLFEDPQRGEMQFRLYDTNGALVTYLPVRLITKVRASPASIGGSTYTGGQTLALIDIPALNAIGSDADYHIKVYRVRRKPWSVDPTNAYEVLPVPSTSENEPWTGWGDDLQTHGFAAHIPIHIKKNNNETHFTPLKGWEDVSGYGLSNDDVDASELVPYPEFELRVYGSGFGSTPPAAWEISLAYPRKKLRIRDVSLRRASQGEAMVRWEGGNPDAVVPCTDNLPGVLKIQVIDPDQQTTGVMVAYQLRNFDDSCGERASDLDFGEWPDSFKAYDLDGNDITSNVDWQIPPSSFF